MHVQYVVRAALRVPASAQRVSTAGSHASSDTAGAAALARHTSALLRSNVAHAPETESDVDASRSSSSWGRLLSSAASDDGNDTTCGTTCLARLIAVTLADIRRAHDNNIQLQWRLIFMQADVTFTVEHVSAWTDAARATEIHRFASSAAAAAVACSVMPPVPSNDVSALVTLVCDDVTTGGVGAVVLALQLPEGSRIVALDQVGACRHRLRPVFQSMWQQATPSLVLPSLSVASLLLQALLTRAHARTAGNRRRAVADDAEDDTEASSDLGLRRYASLLDSRREDSEAPQQARARTRGQGLVSLATAASMPHDAPVSLSEAAASHAVMHIADENDDAAATPSRTHKAPGFFSPDTGLLKQLRRRTKQGREDAAAQALSFDDADAPFAHAQSYRLELRDAAAGTASAHTDADAAQGAQLVQDLRDAAAVATSPGAQTIALTDPTLDTPLSATSMPVFDIHTGMLSREVQDTFSLSSSGLLVSHSCSDTTFLHDDAMHALVSADGSVCSWYLTHASGDAPSPLCAPVSAAAWTAFLRSTHWLTHALLHNNSEPQATSASDFSLMFVSPRRRAVSKMHAHVVSAARPARTSSATPLRPDATHACTIPWRTWCDSHALPHRAVRVLDRLRRAFVFLSDPSTSSAQPCSAARVTALSSSGHAPGDADPMSDPMRFLTNEIPAAHALLTSIALDASASAIAPLPLAAVDVPHASVAFASPARVRRGQEPPPTPVAAAVAVQASPVAHVSASSPPMSSSHTPGRRVAALQSMAAQALELAQSDAELAEHQRGHAFLRVVHNARDRTFGASLWLPCVDAARLQERAQPEASVGPRAAAVLLIDFIEKCMLQPLSQLHAAAHVPLHTRVRQRTLQVALRVMLLASGCASGDCAAMEEEVLTLVRATCAYLPDPVAAHGLHFLSARPRDAAPVTTWLSHVCVQPFSAVIPRLCARLFDDNDYAIPAALLQFAPAPAVVVEVSSPRKRTRADAAPVASSGTKKQRMAGAGRVLPTLAPPKLDVRTGDARSDATLSVAAERSSSGITAASEVTVAPALASALEDGDSRSAPRQARVRAVAALAATRLGDMELEGDSMHSVGASVAGDEAASRDGFTAAMSRRRAHAAHVLAATGGDGKATVDPLMASLRQDRGRAAGARSVDQTFQNVAQRVQVRVQGGFRRSRA